MERQFQETHCRKSSNLAFLRFHHIFSNFARAVVFTNKQCVLSFTLRSKNAPERGPITKATECKLDQSADAELRVLLGCSRSAAKPAVAAKGPTEWEAFQAVHKKPKSGEDSLHSILGCSLSPGGPQATASTTSQGRRAHQELSIYVTARGAQLRQR